MAQLKVLEHGSESKIRDGDGDEQDRCVFDQALSGPVALLGGVVVCLTYGDDVGKGKQGSEGVRWSLHKYEYLPTWIDQ